MSLTRKIWEGLWTGTAASVFENLLRIPRMMIVTRVLGPESYGLLGLFGVFRDVAGNFIQLGTGDAIIQFLATDKARQASEKISATMGAAAFIRLVTIFISLALFFLFEHEIILWMKRYPTTAHVSPREMIWLMRFLLFGIVVQAVEGPFGNALQGFQAWRSLLVVRIVGALASTGFPILAALLGFYLLGIVVAQQLAFVVMAVVIIYYYRIKIKKYLKRPKVKTVLHQLKPVLLFGLPLIFSQFFRLIYTYTDQLMLAGMGKAAAELSYYEVARNAAAMLVFVPALLRSVMFPASAEFYAQQEKSRLQALFTFMVKHLFWFLFPLGAWMAILSPLAIKIIAGSQYLPAARALAWLAIFVVMQAFAVPFFTCLVGALGRTRDQFYITLISGALNVLLNYWLIPGFGFMGAVYATGICHMIGFFLACLFLMPHMKLKFPFYTMVVSLVLSVLFALVIFGALSIHYVLVFILLPILFCLYLAALVRFHVFDQQDAGYLFRLAAPFQNRLPAIRRFVEKNTLPVQSEDRF